MSCTLTCLCFSLVPYLTELIIIKARNCFTFCARLGFLLDVQRTHLHGGFLACQNPGNPVIDKGSPGIWSRWIPFPKYVARLENPAAWLFLFTGFHVCFSVPWECAAGRSPSFCEVCGWKWILFAPSKICRLGTCLASRLVAFIKPYPVSVSQLPSLQCFDGQETCWLWLWSVPLTATPQMPLLSQILRSNCKSVVPP